MIIEVGTIELEELHHKHTEVLRRVDLAPPDFRVHLQEADSKANDTIAAEAPCEDLVHAPLAEKAFDDENEASEGRQFPEELFDHLARVDSVALINGYVDGKPSVGRGKFDNGNLGFCNDRNPVRYPSSLHDIRKGMEDRSLGHPHHRL